MAYLWVDRIWPPGKCPVSANPAKKLLKKETIIPPVLLLLKTANHNTCNYFLFIVKNVVLWNRKTMWSSCSPVLKKWGSAPKCRHRYAPAWKKGSLNLRHTIQLSLGKTKLIEWIISL